MAIDLSGIKNYLRIDDDITHDDAVLQQCIVSAESYCKNSIDNFEQLMNNNKFEPEANMLLYALIAEMYSNRDSHNDSRAEWPYFIRSMISQLQNFAED